MKQNLLFVTHTDTGFDEGLSYALDLARSMDRSIAILLIQKRKLFRRFEDLMSAAAFAEEGEHDTAREIMKQSRGEKHDEDELRRLLKEKCNGSGISVSIYTAFTDTVSALRDFLKQNSGVDMILLSPSITDNGNLSSRQLNNLVRTAVRPIVTMVKHAHAG